MNDNSGFELPAIRVDGTPPPNFGAQLTAASLVGLVDLDPYVSACPCGGQLRTEVRTEWRQISEVVGMFGVSEEDVRSSGARVDGFGRVKAAVPYATCMHCGTDFDLTDRPGATS